MTTVRCYLPLSRADLVRLSDERALAGPLPGYVVTDDIRASNPGGEREEWEYAALQDAAAALLNAGAFIVIAAVDVVAERVRDAADDSSQPTDAVDAPVTIDAVELPRIAALHVGDDVINPGSPHEPDVEIELSWYDTTELAHVTDLVSAAEDARS